MHCKEKVKIWSIILGEESRDEFFPLFLVSKDETRTVWSSTQIDINVNFFYAIDNNYPSKGVDERVRRASREEKMSDFFQNGVITTFHRLGKLDIKRLESELRDFSRIRPIALVLPSLYREYASGALPNIMKELRKATYINQCVLSLDKANRDQYEEVKEAFSNSKKLTVIWNDGPRMKNLYQLLEENNLSPGIEGKGRAVWISLGYVLAKTKDKDKIKKLMLENISGEFRDRLEK